MKLTQAKNNIWNQREKDGFHRIYVQCFARCPEDEPEHDLFLSHSGKDKDFVGLLCKRLKDLGYSPFFDKDPRSLSPGKVVKKAVFAAVRVCHVLVVILSESFFTLSEWPMLELSAFVEAQKEKPDEGIIVPIFFEGLTLEQFREEGKREKWEKRWTEMEKAEKESEGNSTESGKPAIDIQKWKEALEVLDAISPKYTSCVYTQESGFEGLLDKAVGTVCDVHLPRYIFPDPAVQGKDKICEVRAVFLLLKAVYFYMCDGFRIIC
jgi:hypothetical protein